MFGSKTRKIEQLEDDLERLQLQLKLTFQTEQTRYETSERRRLEAVAQVENLKEQLARALDEKQRVSNEHAQQQETYGMLSDELDKTRLKLTNVEDELREARQEAQKVAGQAAKTDWNSFDGDAEEVNLKSE